MGLPVETATFSFVAVLSAMMDARMEQTVTSRDHKALRDRQREKLPN